jgi:hypothetical protein
MLLFLVSCLSDHILTNKIVEERVYYDTAYVEVIIEVEKEVEVEILVPEEFPIWSQSYVQPSLGNGVDILWVVDPSGSMNGNWAQVVLGVEQMMLALPTNIAWRLEIISADAYRARRLESFPILPGDSILVAQQHLQNNVIGYTEEGLDAVKEYLSYNADAHQWLRPNVALLIVFVSDEDDYSTQSVAQFTSWISYQRPEVFVASIVNVDPLISLCPGTFNHNVDIGLKYMAVSNYFMGSVIDICTPDWTTGVAQALQQVHIIDEIQLDYTPVDIDHIEVLVDNVIWTDWTWDEPNNKIVFSIIPPEGSIISVSYNYL